MTTPGASRDTFPLRFKKPRNREALRRMAELTGERMTDVAERAIEHEVILLATDLEARLEEALEVVRSYSAEHDLDSYLDAAAAGEGNDLGPGLRALAVHASTTHPPQRSAAALGILAAFSRG